MVKIAICYWGMTRSIKKNYISHRSLLFDILKQNNIEFSVFLHTWKTDKNMIWEYESPVPIDYEEHKLLEPDHYRLDNQDDFLKTVDFSKYYYEGECEWRPELIRNHLCALESMKRVTNMCLDTNILFDFILFIRPDIEIVTPFQLNYLKLDKNDITIFSYDEFGGYNDKFAIIHFENCRFYSHRIDEIADFRRNHGMITSEGYTKYTIDKYYKRVNFVNFKTNLIRP